MELRRLLLLLLLVACLFGVARPAPKGEAAQLKRAEGKRKAHAPTGKKKGATHPTVPRSRLHAATQQPAAPAAPSRPSVQGARPKASAGDGAHEKAKSAPAEAPAEEGELSFSERAALVGGLLLAPAGIGGFLLGCSLGGGSVLLYEKVSKGVQEALTEYKSKHQREIEGGFRSFEQYAQLNEITVKAPSEELAAAYKQRLTDVLSQPHNRRCFDCTHCEDEMATWASISLGVFVCERCAGMHRALGTHKSRIKSAYADVWTLEMIEVRARACAAPPHRLHLALRRANRRAPPPRATVRARRPRAQRMEGLGNDKGRELYGEAASVRVSEEADAEVLEVHVRDKYSKIKPAPGPLPSASGKLYRCAPNGAEPGGGEQAAPLAGEAGAPARQPALAAVPAPRPARPKASPASAPSSAPKAKKAGSKVCAAVRSRASPAPFCSPARLLTAAPSVVCVPFVPLWHRRSQAQSRRSANRRTRACPARCRRDNCWAAAKRGRAHSCASTASDPAVVTKLSRQMFLEPSRLPLALHCQMSRQSTRSRLRSLRVHDDLDRYSLTMAENAKTVEDGRAWRERRDVSQHLRLIRINGDARAPPGGGGADWFAKRLAAYADELSLPDFEELVAPLLIGVPAVRVADVFRTLSGGASTVRARALLDQLFGRDEPVYLETRRSATAQLSTLFTERPGAGLVNGLADTDAWLGREAREESARAQAVFSSLDQDASHMHRALRELHGVRDPVVRRPGARGGPGGAQQARALGMQAARTRLAPASLPRAKPAHPWASRGVLVPGSAPARSNFPNAPALATLVRIPHPPKGPPALKVATHRPPTVATMAACRPSRQEALVTAVGNARQR